MTSTVSGHVLDWNWKFLGWRDLVSVMDSAHTDTHTYGPNGKFPMMSGRRGASPWWNALLERRHPLRRRHHVLGRRELDAVDGAGLRSSRQVVAHARLRGELERGLKALERD